MKHLEHAEQATVIQWARYRESAHPALKWLHAIPNGGARDARTGAMLQREGVKRGVADLFLPWKAHGYAGYYIEVKRPGALHQVRPEQQEFLDYCKSAGYLANVFDSAQDIINSLEWYLELDHE